MISPIKISMSRNVKKPFFLVRDKKFEKRPSSRGELQHNNGKPIRIGEPVTWEELK